jgi:type I restriction enzyme M protein
MPKRRKAADKSNGATVGYEAQLWQMADALRGSMDAAEYKHVVLGLIFLKYISDAFLGRGFRRQASASMARSRTTPPGGWRA